MKHLYLLILATMALVLPSHALEQRTFFSADKVKSFKATLESYDAAKDVVTVITSSGNKKTFPIKVLSKECQDYVIANQDLLIISKSVRLKFDEVRLPKAGDAAATGYAIEVRNNGKRAIEDITLKYTLYYSQGDLTKGGTVPRTTSGSLSTGKIYDADTLTVQTKKIDIVRKIKKPQGGG